MHKDLSRSDRVPEIPWSMVSVENNDAMRMMYSIATYEREICYASFLMSS
jgi:hypothetical protein